MLEPTPMLVPTPMLLPTPMLTLANTNSPRHCQEGSGEKLGMRTTSPAANQRKVQQG